MNACTATALAGLVLVLSATAFAGDEKAIVGTYRLTERAGTDGKKITGPDVIGMMTFTKTHRTVILKWNTADGAPVSIAYIAAYTLSEGKYCESALYGVNSNLGEPGVTYDTPTAPSCTTVTRDAAGLAFDVPNEKLRLRATRDAIIATTPRWTDHWERLK